MSKERWSHQKKLLRDRVSYFEGMVEKLPKSQLAKEMLDKTKTEFEKAV